MKPIFFKFGLFNAGSLCNGRKHNEFLGAMKQHEPAIMAINETWLKAGQDGRAPVVPGYKMRHVPRNIGTKKGGGGVGFFIRNGIYTQTCAHSPHPDVEQMWVKTKINTTRVIIGTAYRPPWLSIDIFLDALSESIVSFSHYDHIILSGDFNINVLDVKDYKTKRLEQFLVCNNLNNHITQPTHFTDHSSTAIDIICSDATILSADIDHVVELGGHALVFITLNFKTRKVPAKISMCRSLKTVDLSKFNNHLNQLDWDTIFNLNSIDDKLTLFNTLVLYIFDTYSPVKRKVIKDKSKSWITDNVLYMMTLRNNAHKKYMQSKSDCDKNNYKILKHLVNTSLFFEQKAYFEQHINLNLKNPKTLWKNLKQNVIPDFKNKFELPQSFKDPTSMNNNFLNVPGNNLVDPATSMFFESHKFGVSSFSLKSIDENVVARLLLCTKSNAMGHDEITFDMILMTLPRTLAIITHLINSSIETSEVPTAWKIAIVRPIPKISDPKEFSDLRPISILPYLSKILEKVIYEQVSKYLECNNILPEMQSGFRKKRGTATALIDVIDEVLAAQDDGRGTIMVLLDYSRAFDCINVPLLLSKLHYYGFDEKSIRWFRSYFEHRRQIVKLSQKDGSDLLSVPVGVTRGVPQGSILGPLLFILYSADIINCIKFCKYQLYADDLQVYISFHPEDTVSGVVMLNEDLKRLSEWSASNSLVINPRKSKYIVLGSVKQTNNIIAKCPSIVIQDTIVERVDEARNLGLLLDTNLRFESHVAETVRNCFYRLKILYNIRNLLSVDLRVRLCEALILSKLNYCLTAYGPCLLKRTQRLIQRVQNACARFCFQIPPRGHVTPFLNNANLLKMSARQELMFACLLFDTIHTKTPTYLYQKLTWCSNSNRPVRGSRAIILQFPRHRSAAFKGSFRYRATKCWNNIPPPIREIKNKNNFKLKYRMHLLKNQKQNP
jgi:hypothetical protein